VLDLKDKIVLITGASSGIGKACARQFAAYGAKLLLCARRADQLDELASVLRSTHATAVYTLKLDVTDGSAVMDAFKQLPSEWQSIDILINNAGLAAGLDFIHEGLLDDWEAMIDTNIKGLLYVTKSTLPHMIAKDHGHIINIGSIAGHQTYPKGAVYCATKAAVNVLTQGLRMDLLGTKIRVTTVDPGAVHTNFSNVRFKGDQTRAESVYEGMTPLTADDVADAILYAASRKPHVNISEIIIMPTDQAAAMMVSRKQN
jgi:3-hydroxy acid dehydrogenase / malonic semialdehyde reductase